MAKIEELYNEADKQLTKLLKTTEKAAKGRVAQREFAEERIGLAKTSGKQLIEIAEQVADGDESSQLKYVREMITAVKNLEGADLSWREFQNAALGAIADIENIAIKADPVLSSAGKRFVQQKAGELRAYVLQRTQFGSRTSRKVSGFLKKRQSAIAEGLMGSQDALVRATGRLLSRGERREERERTIAEVRTSATQSAADISRSTQYDEDDSGKSARERFIDSYLRPRNEKGQFVSGGGAAGLVRMEAEVRDEIRGLREDMANRDARAQEASQATGEAGQNVFSPTKLSNAGAAAGSPKAKGGGGGAVGGFLGKVFGSAGGGAIGGFISSFVTATGGPGTSVLTVGSFGLAIAALMTSMAGAVKIIQMFGGGDAIQSFLTSIAGGLASFGQIGVSGGLALGAIGLGLVPFAAGLMALTAGQIVTALGSLFMGGNPLQATAEGLLAFNDIDGANLATVGNGMLALGAGLAAITASQLISGLSSFASNLMGLFTGKKDEGIVAMIHQFENIDGTKLMYGGQAIQTLAKGLNDLAYGVNRFKGMKPEDIGGILDLTRQLQGLAALTPTPAPRPVPAPAQPSKPVTPQVAPPSAAPSDLEANITQSLAAQGITDPKIVAATVGNIMKETGGKTRSENLNYSKTSNERIRGIFKSATKGLSDEELNAIKSDPQKMAELAYGKGSKLGQSMGNTEPGEGWKYRGRGYIQLTGKNNYAAASKDVYGDDRLVENPDLLNDPQVAANIAAWFVKRGQKGMASKLGLNLANLTQEQANQLVTSQIAGTAIKRGGEGYLGGEVLSKVDRYAAVTRAAGPLAAATTQLASNQSAPIIIAGGGGSRGGVTAPQPPTLMPVPMRPRDESLQGIYNVNAV